MNNSLSFSISNFSFFFWAYDLFIFICIFSLEKSELFIFDFPSISNWFLDIVKLFPNFLYILFVFFKIFLVVIFISLFFWISIFIFSNFSSEIVSFQFFITFFLAIGNTFFGCILISILFCKLNSSCFLGFSLFLLLSIINLICCFSSFKVDIQSSIFMIFAEMFSFLGDFSLPIYKLIFLTIIVLSFKDFIFCSIFMFCWFSFLIVLFQSISLFLFGSFIKTSIFFSPSILWLSLIFFALIYSSILLIVKLYCWGSFFNNFFQSLFSFFSSLDTLIFSSSDFWIPSIFIWSIGIIILLTCFFNIFVFLTVFFIVIFISLGIKSLVSVIFSFK